MKIKCECLLPGDSRLNDAIEHSLIMNTAYVRIVAVYFEANANIQRKLDHILFSKISMASSLTKSESFLLLSIVFTVSRHHKNILWASKKIWMILREVQCKDDGY